MGGGQYSYRIGYPRRGSFGSLPPVEHEQPGGLVLGMVILPRIARRRLINLGKSIRRCTGHCAGRNAGGSGLFLPFDLWLPPGRRRHSCRPGGGSAVGDNVRSLSQGLPERHEPAFVRDGVHDWRTGHDDCTRDYFPWRMASTYSRSRASQTRPFWLFLGGFFWVIGDIFQQYAAKYIGIGRGIPLSNTNQLWGLAWGVLVFGELRTLSSSGRWMIIAGSLVMIVGAIALSSAVAPDAERTAWREAVARECHRYELNFKEADAAQQGMDAMAERAGGWSVWDVLILIAAVAIFAALAYGAALPAIFIRAHWMMGLLAAMLALLLICGSLLWKWTRFS